ncbi:MAG: glycosyltransferase family 39 protein [Chitinophagaceae bacterium]|nr:MAG: glycosyltransferase family 39 protein [Chitinophagaceae bacterium]
MDLLAFVKKYHKLVFYGAWFAMNIIQAASTELLDDEAYYWIYSNFLDWGYYDHPPMIALLIKGGTWWLPGELGVRFMIVLVNTATLLVIQALLEKKNPLLFYGILMSLAIAQVGGIIAAPDLPLMFFAALFFLLYRRFLDKMSLLNTALLGLNIALMLYSKYHGVLIVFFTLLSNPKLFLKYQTYVAGVIALVLFSPHLYWQYTHGFPSVQYHLVERNATHYRFTYTIEYLLGQLLIVGPLMGWFFLWTAFRHRPSSLTEKALKYSMIGFYLFFLVSTIKGRVEVNWTVPVIVALIILSHQFIADRPNLQKWVFNTVIFSLALVLVFRVYLVIDIHGSSLVKKDEFHQNKSWSSALRLQSKGLPLVSVSSYQQASKYWFYTGIESYSLNTPDYRRNNFNYWPVSDSLLGKTVYALGRYDPYILKDTVQGKGEQINGGAFIDSFFSFSKVQFTDIENVSASQGIVSLDCEISVPPHYLKVFRLPPYNRALIQIAIVNNDTVPDYFSTNVSVDQIRQLKTKMRLSVAVPIEKGEYLGRLATESRIRNQPTLNSATFSFTMK